MWSVARFQNVVYVHDVLKNIYIHTHARTHTWNSGHCPHSCCLHVMHQVLPHNCVDTQHCRHCHQAAGNQKHAKAPVLWSWSARRGAQPSRSAPESGARCPVGIRIRSGHVQDCADTYMRQTAMKTCEKTEREEESQRAAHLLLAHCSASVGASRPNHSADVYSRAVYKMYCIP